LLDNPKIGILLKGTKGIRKLRIEMPNRGKSGGARIIYVDFAYFEKIYLLTAYAKSKTENLTKAERNELRQLVILLELELIKKG
jgi:hypothetical protein